MEGWNVQVLDFLPPKASRGPKVRFIPRKRRDCLSRSASYGVVTPACMNTAPLRLLRRRSVGGLRWALGRQQLHRSNLSLPSASLKMLEILELLGPMAFEIRWEREKRMTRGKRGGWNLGSELELLELDSLRSAKVRA